MILFCVLVLSAYSAAGTLYEGDFCDKNGAQGTCISLSRCSSALQELKNKSQPQLCSFNESEPVVCCTDNSPALIPVPSTTMPPQETSGQRDGCKPVPLNITALKTGRRSWDRCIEYQERLVYPCTKGVLSEGFSRMNYCHHNAEELILGGSHVRQHDFSHMAKLGIADGAGNTTWLSGCDGALIDEHFVLTPAHCVNPRDGLVSHVLIGSNSFKVKSSHSHPDYKPTVRRNDIALLELEKPVPLDTFTVPACLPVGKVIDDRAYLTGWDILLHDSNSQALQEIQVDKIPGSTCVASLPPRLLKQGLDESTQVCYQDRTNSVFSCQGFSGILHIKNKKIHCMYTVVGLMSIAGGCAEMAPSVYTRVAGHVPWIESVVWAQ